MSAAGSASAAGAPGIGIDLLEIERLERALERRPRLALRLFTDAEREYAQARARPGQHLAARFCAKEAVYKAVYPLDQTFLDHHDVQISFAERKAVVRNGRVVELRFCIAAHLVALAFLPGLR